MTVPTPEERGAFKLAEAHRIADLHPGVNELLAAERRRVVERIRDRLFGHTDVGTMVLPGHLDHLWLDGKDVAEVLDLEAARD